MPLERKYYCLRYPNGDYVGLDDASGGYPYPANRLTSIKFWASPEEADQYRQVGRNKEGFTIHLATFTSEPVVEEKQMSNKTTFRDPD